MKLTKDQLIMSSFLKLIIEGKTEAPIEPSTNFQLSHQKPRIEVVTKDKEVDIKLVIDHRDFDVLENYIVGVTTAPVSSLPGVYAVTYNSDVLVTCIWLRVDYIVDKQQQFVARYLSPSLLSLLTAVAAVIDVKDIIKVKSHPEIPSDAVVKSDVGAKIEFKDSDVPEYWDTLLECYPDTKLGDRVCEARIYFACFILQLRAIKESLKNLGVSPSPRLMGLMLRDTLGKKGESFSDVGKDILNGNLDLIQYSQLYTTLGSKDDTLRKINDSIDHLIGAIHSGKGLDQLLEDDNVRGNRRDGERDRFGRR